LIRRRCQRRIVQRPVPSETTAASDSLEPITFSPQRESAAAPTLWHDSALAGDSRNFFDALLCLRE
jgi:hypothetical protein